MLTDPLIQAAQSVEGPRTLIEALLQLIDQEPDPVQEVRTLRAVLHRLMEDSAGYEELIDEISCISIDVTSDNLLPFIAHFSYFKYYDDATDQGYTDLLRETGRLADNTAVAAKRRPSWPDFQLQPAFVPKTTQQVFM